MRVSSQSGGSELWGLLPPLSSRMSCRTTMCVCVYATLLCTHTCCVFTSLCVSSVTYQLIHSLWWEWGRCEMFSIIFSIQISGSHGAFFNYLTRMFVFFSPSLFAARLPIIAHREERPTECDSSGGQSQGEGHRHLQGESHTEGCPARRYCCSLLPSLFAHHCFTEPAQETTSN